MSGATFENKLGEKYRKKISSNDSSRFRYRAKKVFSLQHMIAFEGLSWLSFIRRCDFATFKILKIFTLHWGYEWLRSYLF